MTQRIGTRAGLGLVVALAALVGAAPAQADITRSCAATLVVSPDGSGNDVSYSYSARVNAQNRAWANRAREQARSNIIECFQLHWDMRMTENSPVMCRPEGGMDGYPFRALSQDLTRDICAANPGRDSMVVDVTVQITGQRGCELPNEWAPVSLVDDYRVYCATPPQPEQREGWNLPGMDYRWFEMAAGARAADCEAICTREDRCRAWTYKHPSGDDPALCFLKQGVPDWARDARFVSGIKGEVLH
ncbi:MAG: PAN domain-containing protein [Paracoccaceae bacterium]